MIGLTFFGCNKHIKSDNNETNFVLELPDTSKKDFPIIYKVKENLVKELNLQNLENGVDTFELRLWVKSEPTNGGQVFIIKKIKNEWTCFNYFYIEGKFKWIDNREIYENFYNFSVDTFWVKKRNPKSNWINFMQKIDKEGIFELQNQSDIIGWKDIVEDGITYSVEYANNSKYRFYSYNCPDVYSDNFIDCKRMTNILEIFDEEIGLNLIYGNRYKCK